tara:strand:- start:1646 stop:1951 length:306 start_codon:yes stop_codon:yes gene_type:complete
MKKILFFMPIILIIIATTLTKNSTKQLDKKIFEAKENLRILYDTYELVLLDYNYLTSPKKLMQYQKIYFEKDLIESDILYLNSINLKKNEIEINRILKIND